MNRGRLFLISGPSGSGKDTVLKEIFKMCPEIAFSISSVTRPMRAGEVEGEKYNFISVQQFEDMLKNDAFLEHNIFVDNYYGTPKAPVEECLMSGRDMIAEIDVNGARQIRQKIKDAVSIFIMPPSLNILKQRLSNRGTECQEAVDKRINEALREIACASEYDYIVVNDVLDDAVRNVVTVIKADRFKLDRQGTLINDVLCN